MTKPQDSYFTQLAKTLCSILIFVGTIALGVGFYHVVDDWRTNWQPAPARITGFEPLERWEANTYSLCVHIEYTVDDTHYSRRICGGRTRSRHATRQEARELGEKKYGHISKIWFDSANPQRSRLRQSVLPLATAAVFGGMATIGSGIYGHRRLRGQRQGE